MSIPTSIDPIGTLGGELPYIQPIMTSDTTWSNMEGKGAASFGCSISGYSYVYPRWNVLTPRNTSRKPDGTYSWYSAASKSPIIITFEQPIKLKRVEVAQRFSSDKTNPNWLKLTGDGKTILDFVDSDRDWGSQNYRWFTCDDIGYFNVLRIYYAYNGSDAQLFPIVLDAVYKP